MLRMEQVAHKHAIKPLLALAFLAGLPTVVAADTWKGSVRVKAQADNRYNKNGDYTGESWQQLYYDNPDAQFKARVSFVGRASTDIYREKLQTYQAYLEKEFRALPLTVRGGRFEKSDNLGLYLLDGGQASYGLTSLPLTIEAYAGQPLRVDHVQSVHGKFVAGTEAMFKLTPNWSLGNSTWAHINAFDVKTGFQAMQQDLTQVTEDVLVSQGVDINGDVIEQQQTTSTSQTNATTTYRLNAAVRFAGHLLGQDKPMETFIKGSYAAEKNQIENAFVDSWWDVMKNVRLRNYYEAYRPKQQFVTFRDRFYSAYALGQQEVWRGSAEHRVTDKLRYSLGAQYASRDEGYDGYGFNGGLSYALLPGVNLSGAVDYLELSSHENAKSLYLSGSHALNSKTRYSLNLALREEDKTLYGHNFAKGIETEWQYMLQNDWVLAFKASYIDNTQLYNEYLGAFQVTYFFDRFQASKP
ncbi:MAG: hypothetical protein NTV43_11895 [Methylococcales bacterium]|nr:hypothetical protein [Methylococcales bacterium]